MSKQILEIRRVFSAGVESVFDAWTKPELMKQWFCPETMTVPVADVDLTQGGKYRVQMQNSEGETYTTFGEYVEVVANKKLVFTWGWEGDERVETLVTVEFTAQSDNATEVYLKHERFENQESCSKHEEGWTSCFNHFERFLA